MKSWVENWSEKYPKFKEVDRAIEKEGWKIVALVRLSPLIPFSFVNYALALTSVRFVEYALMSWISMLPETIIFCWVCCAIFYSLFSGF